MPAPVLKRRFLLLELTNAASGFSMASLKRRAFNEYLIARISDHLAQGHSLEKSSPAYEELCNYGTITEKAA
jgi:hypothetical protein